MLMQSLSTTYASDAITVPLLGAGKPPRFIVHHKTHLSPENVGDDSVVYGWDNLELLCIYCHNAVHGTGMGRECVFDDDGNPIGILEHNR